VDGVRQRPHYEKPGKALVSAPKKISGRIDAVPAEYEEQIEGANAFFIIPAVSKISLMELH